MISPFSTFRSAFRFTILFKCRLVSTLDRYYLSGVSIRSPFFRLAFFSRQPLRLALDDSRYIRFFTIHRCHFMAFDLFYLIHVCVTLSREILAHIFRRSPSSITKLIHPLSRHAKTIRLFHIFIVYNIIMDCEPCVNEICSSK